MSEHPDFIVDGKLVPLHEILDFLEGNDDAIGQEGVNISLLPPTNATQDLTDEDSGDEHSPIIDNLPPSQLLAPAIVNRVSSRIDEESDDETIVDDPQPSTSKENIVIKKKGTKRPIHKKQNKKSYKWEINQTLQSELREWPPMVAPNHNLSPVEYFDLFFDQKIIDMIVTHTNEYARQINRTGDISVNEIYSFLGVLLLSGYNVVPRKAMYWEQSEDTHNPLVANAISRDRFQYVMINIHVCDNHKLDKNDRFSKIRPLLSAINERCQAFTPHSQDHSVDESMVPYFGRHGAKQFIRGKPIRYGYKFWCGGPSSGYISWIEPYQGAGTLPEKYASHGLGYGVVMAYADTLKGDFPYRIYFDNFFTSCELLTELEKRKIGGTGTIRLNRLDKACPLRNKDDMKNATRGKYTFYSDLKNHIMVLSWKDNNVVSFATNFEKIHPIHNVSRYSQEKKKRIYIEQPDVVSNYNKRMGGIDRADQNISLYRVSIRGKKWYFPLIAHMVDISVQNAWQLHKYDGGTLDHLAFRRRIAKAILERNRKLTSAKGRPSLTAKIDSRFDKIEHYVGDTDVDEKSGKKKQLHCRVCKKKATTLCLKCSVPLHTSCFLTFHTK